MEITDIFSQMGGLQSMARELGVSEDQVASGADALVPAILGGFKKQAQSQGIGLDGLGGLLSQLGGGSLLDQVLSPQATDVSQGNEVLGQIFGSKDVSNTVTQNAASQSGLDPSLLKKMLPMLAMLVAGYMAKQGGIPAAGGSAPGPDDAAGGLGGLGGGLGGLGGLLGGLLNSQSGQGAATQAGGSGPLGSLGAMLDLNGDGNSLDDIMRMAGKALR